MNLNPTKILNRRLLALEEEYFFFKAWNYLRSQKIEGDYLEFGVYQGKSFIKSVSNAQRHHFPSTEFYAFDSFQGLPEPEQRDPIYHGGQFSASRAKFEKNLQRGKIDMNRVHILEGWFEDTLTEENKKRHSRPASMVMIDCDLYSSAITCLNYITDLVQEGTIILLDDWFTYRANEAMGEQRAINEWLASNPEIKLVPYLNFMVLGKSFIVRTGKGKAPQCVK